MHSLFVVVLFVTSHIRSQIALIVRTEHHSVADLDGAEPAQPPFWRRTDAVTILLISKNGTVLWRELNFDCSAVKHALQNTQNKSSSGDEIPERDVTHHFYLLRPT